MPDHMYNAGSVYNHAPASTPGAAEAIANAADLPAGAHLYTIIDGQPALVTSGEVYLFAGKVDGFVSPWSHPHAPK